MKQQFLKDKTDTIRLTVYQDNRPLIPSSAKVTLYTPSGGSLQAQADATVNATTGEMTYSLTTTHTADHDLNYKAEWEYVVDAVTYYQQQLFDVVKSILAIPITDDDIYQELESLRKTNLQAQGTASSATSSTLLDTAKRKEPDDYWKGCIIEILSGTGANQKRDITGFTQSSSTVTVSPNWTTTPDNTSVYRIVKSFNDKIGQAFEEVQTMIYNKGKRHSLILESSQIKLPVLFLTIHKICLDLTDEEGDKWDRLSTKYEEKFNTVFGNMIVDYDEDESGSIDEDEEQLQPNEVRLYRT